jgi:hypothetical protein
VNLEKLGAARVAAWWYNPRDGAATAAGEFDGVGAREFTCPSEGFGSNWVLVLDDAARRFPKPGTALAR